MAELPRSLLIDSYLYDCLNRTEQGLLGRVGTFLCLLVLPVFPVYHLPMTSFNSPFRKLKHIVKPPSPSSRSAEKPAPQASSSSPPESGQTPEELFWQEMAGVVPLGQEDRARVEGIPPALFTPRPLVDSEADALAELSDVVLGKKGFDITDTDEYIEGAVVGLDLRLVSKLRQGDFPRQAHLDLHGMTTDVAQTEVEQFFTSAVRDGLRCILIVHGRGRNSAGQVPVLKDRLKSWLSRGKLAKLILAFATARQHDGGPGALYVLLRRVRKGKEPIVVLEGAKQE